MLITLFDREMVKQTKLNVFVKNLPRTATSKKLYEMFLHIGDIFSCKLPQDYKGRPKNYGFVQFRTLEAVDKAIAEMNGFAIEDKKLVVEKYNPTERKEPRGFTNVYVKNLPANVTTDAALKDLFAGLGTVKSVCLKESQLKDKKGYFGFVAFDTPEQAKQVVDAMHNKVVEGVQLYVAQAQTGEQRAREMLRKRIELRNQSRKFTLHVKSTKSEPLVEAQLLEELKPFGEIKQIAIMKQNTDSGPVNMPIGFVVFAREEDAVKVPVFSPDRPSPGTPRAVPWRSISFKAASSDASASARSTPPQSRITAPSLQPCTREASTPCPCVHPCPEPTTPGWAADPVPAVLGSLDDLTTTRLWTCA